MSIESVKKAYEVFTHKDTCLLWTDEETYDVINAIAQHILNQDPPKSTPIEPSRIESIPEGYLRVRECAEKIGFIGHSTLTRYVHNHDFNSNCAVLRNAKWYIHPGKAHDYLIKHCTVFRNRMDRINSMKK